MSNDKGPGSMTGDELVAACKQEMEVFTMVHGFVQFGTEISVLMQMISAMQLALRHPNFPVSARAAVESAIADISDALSDYPALVEMIRRGQLAGGEHVEETL